jgi:hypothetical protein
MKQLSPYRRLFNRVKIDENGCWNYTGFKDKFGYGRLRGLDGHKILAHRLSYEENYGPIPEDMMVLHSCDNPACVNPEHLRLGTQTDNMQDMTGRKRQWLQRAKEQGLSFDVRNKDMPEDYKKLKEK